MKCILTPFSDDLIHSQALYILLTIIGFLLLMTHGFDIHYIVFHATRHLELIENKNLKELRESDPVILTNAQKIKVKDAVSHILDASFKENVKEMEKSFDEFLDKAPELFGDFLFENLEIATHEMFDDLLKNGCFDNGNVRDIDGFIEELSRWKRIVINVCEGDFIQDFEKKILVAYARFLLCKNENE